MRIAPHNQDARRPLDLDQWLSATIIDLFMVVQPYTNGAKMILLDILTNIIPISNSAMGEKTIYNAMTVP